MRPPKRIQPKLRSMPRKHTPSAIYLQMHQLANEKERLQQEVAMLQDRQRQVLQRLIEIETDLLQLEAACEQCRLPEAQSHAPVAEPCIVSSTPFRWMTIDY
ncbi:MAG: gas vesicle protein GvpV [Oscillatoriales cyanobacterium SM2_2_1]|nr:gas vesicle protein GvpV [Oscillatoriales cyanobacterium SM2_2_1]